MGNLHLDYLVLLGELNKDMEQLSQLAQKKSDAVRRDDLIALDQVLKQEQVVSLSIRGQEQRRLKLLSQLGLSDVPLSRLASHYPAELQLQARQAAETLLRSYDLYRAAAEVARNTLECNLHELDKIVSDLGGAQAAGAGYTSPDIQPPQKMKTDFRA